MIDITQETVIPITEAAQHIPGRPSIPTLWRWVLKGTRGNKLESILVGGRRFTSVEAIQRYCEQEAGPTETGPRGRTSTQRERDLSKADRECAEAGM